MKIQTANSPRVSPKSTAHTARADQAAASTGSTAWTPKSTPEQRRMLGRTIDEAIALPAGTSLRVRLGHVRAAMQTIGPDARALVTERLAAHLPAASAEERERVLQAADFLGARTPALTQRLLQDATRSGDARLALVLVDAGATLAPAARAQLAPLLRGDELLTSPDATRNLARAAVAVLADDAVNLRAFAQSLTSPEILFSEVLANRDQRRARALTPVVDLLTPSQAALYARKHGVPQALRTELRRRAAEAHVEVRARPISTH